MVNIAASKFGWDSFRGPAAVLEISGKEYLVAMENGGQDVWFNAQRVEEMK